MRSELQDAISHSLPDHAGLAYEISAPMGDDGKVKDGDRAAWLKRFESLGIPTGYAIAFQRFQRSTQRSDTRCLTVRAEGRLLLGHGNPSPTDVGLTLHRTWGVPLIPGSSLKGLAAAYVEATYGPDPGVDEPDREPFRGVVWEGKRIARGPGAAYRRLFGAPDADDESKASRGEVIVHDALWIPEGGKLPLARDVLTVHQKHYYGAQGGPTDYDAPNPVSFLTVRPGARFLVALSGPEDLLGPAERCVKESLALWGAGGKTAAGYGRLVLDRGEDRSGGRVAGAPRTRAAKLDELEAWIARAQAEKRPALECLSELERDWADALVALAEPDRQDAKRLLNRFIPNDKRTKERRQALLARLATPET